MLNNESNVVIVGGGIPGMFSALLVAVTQPDVRVHLVDWAPRLGGLYGSHKDPDFGWLDHGMHLIYETGIEGVDRLIREVMNDSEWIFLEGNKKDIAGVHHLGKLNTASPYVDLRALPATLRDRALAGLFAALPETRLGPLESKSAADFFVRRFGAPIAREVIDPILRKLWRLNSDELDAMVSRVVLMDRVQLFDSKVMADLMKSDRIRSRIAFPDQIELPLQYRTFQRGLYPKRFGMVNVINALEKALRERNVNIRTSSKVGALELDKGRMTSLRLESAAGNEVERIGKIGMLHWGTPLPHLANLLGVSLPRGGNDPPLVQSYVYLMLREAPAMGGLYYFYAFDPGYCTYRVTDYASYCPDARQPDGSWLICAELHYDPGAKVNTQDAREQATRELLHFGVIADRSEVLAVKVFNPPGGFPLLTLRNCNRMRDLRLRIEEKAPANLVLGGQAPERGVFFLHDVLAQCYRDVIEYQEWR